LSNIIARKMPTQRSARVPPAVSSAGPYADYLHRCIEEERAALAREVHDDIGGALAALRFDLGWIGRHTDDAAVKARVDGATEMLAYAIDACQRIAQDLQPPALAKGLAAAVRGLAAGFERRTGIKTRFTSASAAGIEPGRAVQQVAYRTAQEALTNIGKHAQCSEVSIALRAGATLLTLEIADNGQGVSRAALDKAAALGLKGLRQRARTVNGRLRVGSRHGEGTAVVLRVPLHEAAVAPASSGRGLPA
jgi:signal transduction histidine kinase